MKDIKQILIDAAILRADLFLIANDPESREVLSDATFWALTRCIEESQELLLEIRRLRDV